MFREKLREKICEVAKNHDVPKLAMIEDSNREGKLFIRVSEGGDIGLKIVSADGNFADITFSGVGGGDIDRPLTKEALRLLALVMQEES